MKRRRKGEGRKEGEKKEEKKKEEKKILHQESNPGPFAKL